jgi:hypothetical protein
MGWQPPKDLTTTFGAPLIFGKPECYMFAQTPTIVYVGDAPGVAPKNRIFQLRWENNAWKHKNQSFDAGAPVATFEVRAYVHYAGGTQNVVYLNLNEQNENQVHQLYADNSNEWQHNNLTTAVPGGAPFAEHTPTGYEFRHLQHVVYDGTDKHIYELWQDSNGWHVNDLTNAPAVGGAPLTARVFTPIATQNIPFLEYGSGHIHELWWDNSGTWRRSDLTLVSQAPSAGSEPTNYSFWEQATQHINYAGSDGHVHELWWDYENGWQHNDLTYQTGAPLLRSGAVPSGYVFRYEGTQHVVYQGGDGIIHELWWDNTGWHHNPLTMGAPDALLAGNDPTGFETTVSVGQGTQRVIYATRESHVIELKWTP